MLDQLNKFYPFAALQNTLISYIRPFILFLYFKYL